MKFLSHVSRNQGMSKGTTPLENRLVTSRRNASITWRERRHRTAVCLSFLLIFGCYASQGQTRASDTGKLADDKKMDRLLVYGKGFMFAATEPDGWHGDTEKVAQYYYSNLIFLPEDKLSKAAHVNIRVRVNNKETTDPSEDMQTDMTGYKAKYPKVKFSDLALSHSKYKVCAKLFSEEAEHYEYVVYVDPGLGIKMNFSVSMSKDAVPATPEEMKAFESVLHSLSWISGNIHVQ